MTQNNDLLSNKEKESYKAWLTNLKNRFRQVQIKAVSNFVATLPEPQSDLARQTLKDPYIFDFISLTKDYTEKELEEELNKLEIQE